MLYAAALLSAAASLAPWPVSSVAGQDSSTPLESSILRLKVLPEHPSGYDRAKFPHWDELPTGCSVRETVLIQESLTPARYDRSSCKVVSGKWLSAYDGSVSVDPSTIDIDHVVALKESWDSGAWSWTATRRRSYANDLSDPRSLAAVSAASNRKKSDKDPAGWLPFSPSRCAYVSDWVSIKLRWGLSVDPAELSALLSAARGCKDGSTVLPPQPATPAPSITSTVPTQSGSTTTYYATCSAARAALAAPLYRGSPGYRPGLDRDGDGIACE